MGLTGRLLLDTAVAMAALVVGVIFLIFRNELSRAHDAASHSSLVANTRAGPNGALLLEGGAGACLKEHQDAQRHGLL